MTEVVKSNFQDLYPKIEGSLKKAAFIAIDSEFSGLISHSKLKNSLFDSISERYQKLKCNIEQITIFQFGLAIFHYNRDSNQYIVDVYNFYTFPCSFGPVDNRFLCQATSWEFLRAHNFNFNKVAYEGVPFLSSFQEKQIRTEINAGSMMTNMERSLSYREEEQLQSYSSRIAEWLTKATVGESLDIEVSPTDYCLKYFLHKEIRNRFKDVWTFRHPNKVVVRKLKSIEIAAVREAEGEILEEELLDNLVGFGKVFRLLVELKKPIIGHNLLLDLLILYNQMYKPLPTTYKEFKKQLNSMFPSIFDTKHTSYEIRQLLQRQDHWTSNRLDILYTYFHSSKGKRLAAFSPAVIIKEERFSELENIESHVHEAAWDAYMSGYCFVRMAHYLAVRRMGISALPRALSRVEHMSAMEVYRNRLNVIRANISHVNIGGEEPPSSRPRLLYMTRLDRQPINIDTVTCMMAIYCSVDVKGLTPSSVIIAVPNKLSSRDIVRAFVGNPEYRVVPYSYLRHSSVITTLLWSGLILSSSVLGAAFLTKVIMRN